MNKTPVNPCFPYKSEKYLRFYESKSRKINLNDQIKHHFSSMERVKMGM